jgi:hypothetical protein
MRGRHSSSSSKLSSRCDESLSAGILMPSSRTSNTQPSRPRSSRSN